MIENARRGGQWVGVEMELGKEKYNERSEGRGRHRNSETGTASKSKVSLTLPKQGMPIYMHYMWRGGIKLRKQPARVLLPRDQVVVPQAFGRDRGLMFRIFAFAVRQSDPVKTELVYNELLRIVLSRVESLLTANVPRDLLAQRQEDREQSLPLS